MTTNSTAKDAGETADALHDVVRAAGCADKMLTPFLTGKIRNAKPFDTGRV